MAQSNPRVEIAPLVILTILDQYSRRAASQERVCGFLLGSHVSGVMSLRNAMPFPHNVFKEQTIDGKIAATMVMDAIYEFKQLHFKACQRDQPVGWYTTSYALQHTHAVHHSLTSHCATTTPTPLLLVCDPSSAASGHIDMRTLVAWSGLPALTVCPALREIPHTIVNSPWDSAVLATVASSVVPDLVKLAPRIEALNGPPAGVGARLQAIADDLDDVAKKADRSDPTICRQLMALLDMVGPHGGDSFDQAALEAVQDLLGSAYVADLVHAQALLAERLHKVPECI